MRALDEQWKIAKYAMFFVVGINIMVWVQGGEIVLIERWRANLGYGPLPKFVDTIFFTAYGETRSVLQRVMGDGAFQFACRMLDKLRPFKSAKTWSVAEGPTFAEL